MSLTPKYSGDLKKVDKYHIKWLISDYTECTEGRYICINSAST